MLISAHTIANQFSRITADFNSARPQREETAVDSGYKYKDPSLYAFVKKSFESIK